MRKLFGTDGIRAVAGVAPLDERTVFAVGVALAHTLGAGAAIGPVRVLLGLDTRESGPWIAAALAAGLRDGGAAVENAGVITTPAIAYLARKHGFSAGVVISASHNPWQDNGIKIFGGDGYKLPDEVELGIEAEIERVLANDVKQILRSTQEDNSEGDALPEVNESFRAEYVQFLLDTVPGLSLDNRTVVIDCANGAAYKVAPRVLADLGAEIVPIGCSPNGRNINDGCGSTAPELLQLTVPGVRAHVGLALDGDGDRVMMVDELGRCVDGDQLLFILATARRKSGELRGPVVGTVMSNLGLEHALAERDIGFRRAQVGDRYVLGLLNETGGTLGGETSGHILCLDKTTTGDGLVSALQVLAVMKSTGASLAELAAPMRRYPQALLNVKVARRFDPMADPGVAAAAAKVERQFAGRGRIVLRASGTEPVIRVMVEGADADLVKRGARDIVVAVEAAASAGAADGSLSE